MKKALITMMCLAAMFVAGTGLKAQEIPITLAPGCNWISYPNAEAMPIGEALGSFTPENGDIIQSQFDGYCLYLDGSWRGDLTHFVPGLGYKYYSARSEDVEFVFAHPASSSVATAMPTDITVTSAVVGGTVTLPESTQVFMRGVCWGTEPRPDIDGGHTSEETGIGSFSSTLEDLNANTTYYVRAYVVYDHGLAYGNELSFSTEAGGGGDHAYVDLGLPSGLLWATCNVGADNPEDYGDYFAWGETQPKDYYDWSSYQYCNGSQNTLTKYCNNSEYGYNGFTDNLTTLQPEDDAATANWGTVWRMPTDAEWQELLDNTTHTWTTQNGVNGRLFTASNGNSLFLPAAGFLYTNGNLANAGGYGFYWSSSLYTSNPRTVRYFYFRSDFLAYVGTHSRCDGYSVRPVRSASQTTSFSIDATASPSEGGTVAGTGNYTVGSTCTLIATANEGYTFANWTENGSQVSTNSTYTFTVNADRTLVANFTYNGGGDHAYVDLGLPSGLLWATCNVGADIPEDYGDYFAWGETQPKDTYNWSTYQYCMGSKTTLTKYCNDASYGYNGFTDNLTTLLPEDDAATANWGSDWRMPTREEWQELYTNTTVTWTQQNGVNGRLFTASNGNSLFLPAAGYRYSSVPTDAGSYGYYWSSSLSTDGPRSAWNFYFYSGGYDVSGYYRSYGQSVRPVRVGSQN